MKLLINTALILLVLYGISSARELDGIVGNINLNPQPTTISKVTQDIDVSNLIQDTALLILPNSDDEEFNNYTRSKAILVVNDLGSDDNYAYSLETFVGYSQITMIPLSVFPNWYTADNTEGYTNRGTDSWNEVAKLKQENQP